MQGQSNWATNYDCSLILMTWQMWIKWIVENCSPAFNIREDLSGDFAIPIRINATSLNFLQSFIADNNLEH